jgi:hypothetical protein
MRYARVWLLGLGEDLLRLRPQGVRISPTLAAVPRPRVAFVPSPGEALSSRSEDLSASVEFVKTLAIAFARLRRDDISGVRLVGLANADPERHTLAIQLIEDHREVLGPDVALVDLPFNEGFVLLRDHGKGAVVEIDVRDL